MSAGLPTDSRGAVQFETLLALIPLFLLLVGLTQLAMLQVAQLIVKHAADRAVRSAIVLLNDTRDAYSDSAPGALLDKDGRTPTARLRDVTRAARAPLRAITPHPLAQLKALANAQSVADALRTDPVALALAALGTSTDDTKLEFPVAPGSEGTHHSAVPLSGSIHVRVRHRFECLVPIANKLMCAADPDAPYRRVHWFSAEASLPSQRARYDTWTERDG